MDDLAFGRLVRLARIERRWRQEDVAERAGVSRSTVSRLERGHVGQIPLDTVRAVCAVLDIRVQLHARARALDLDRVANARHSGLAEHVALWMARWQGWAFRAEVSYSEYGERGVVDLLCWHAASRSLLIVELKTELLEFGALLGKLDEKERLGPVIAKRLGWAPVSVSTGLLVADSTTNRRRARAHGALLGSALPDDSRALVGWLKRPAGVVRALRFVPDARPGHVRNGFAGPTRVRTPATRRRGS
jgi:transcriptional regulator with XRE-family HTH domain